MIYLTIVTIGNEVSSEAGMASIPGYILSFPEIHFNTL